MNTRKQYFCSFTARPNRNRGVQHHFIVIAENMTMAFIEAIKYWSNQFPETSDITAPDRIVITAGDAYPPLGKNHEPN